MLIAVKLIAFDNSFKFASRNFTFATFLFFTFLLKIKKIDRFSVAWVSKLKHFLARSGIFVLWELESSNIFFVFIELKIMTSDVCKSSCLFWFTLKVCVTIPALLILLPFWIGFAPRWLYYYFNIKYILPKCPGGHPILHRGLKFNWNVSLGKYKKSEIDWRRLTFHRGAKRNYV